MNYRKIYEDSKSNISQMLQGYLEAVVFTGAMVDEESANACGIEYNESDPTIYSFSINDITPSATTRAEEDCLEFVKKAGDLLAGHNLPHGEPIWDDVGRNFWLSRNGHGAGFFDKTREFGDSAEPLQELARGFPEAYPFLLNNGDIDIEIC
jgi:hypothetical protein